MHFGGGLNIDGLSRQEKNWAAPPLRFKFQAVFSISHIYKLPENVAHAENCLKFIEQLATCALK